MTRWEWEAMPLAESIPAGVLLIDEQIGRTIARSRNIPLSLILGVLERERADGMGFVRSFPQVSPSIEGERLLYG
jgi:predicted nucleic acid-binding protein